MFEISFIFSVSNGGRLFCDKYTQNFRFIFASFVCKSQCSRERIFETLYLQYGRLLRSVVSTVRQVLSVIDRVVRRFDGCEAMMEDGMQGSKD
jgi:hypothetical protein